MADVEVRQTAQTPLRAPLFLVPKETKRKTGKPSIKRAPQKRDMEADVSSLAVPLDVHQLAITRETHRSAGSARSGSALPHHGEHIAHVPVCFNVDPHRAGRGES